MREQTGRFLLALLLVIGVASGCGVLDRLRDEPTEEIEPSSAPGMLPVTGDEGVPGIRVESISLNLSDTMPVQVSVTVYGNLPDDCTRVGGVSQATEGNTIYLALLAERLPSEDCIEGAVYFEQTVPVRVEGLRPGVYAVDVNGLVTELTFDAEMLGASEPEGCLPAGIGQVRYQSVEDGYCLLYPTSYDARWTARERLSLLGMVEDGSGATVDIRMTIVRAGRADGQPAHALAASALATQGVSADACILTITRLDGERMIVAEAEGRARWRRLAHVVHRDVLYVLELAPIAQDSAQAAVQADLLWATVTASFRFYAPLPIDGGLALEPTGEQRAWSAGA
ncbi:MAG: hypothetical protein ACYC4R_03450 [Anaerolineae bacterium]